MAKQIIVFSKDNCMQCDFTKKYLEEKGIDYSIKNIEKDQSALEEVKTLGFQTVPVVVAEGLEPFFGFRPNLLAQLG